MLIRGIPFFGKVWGFKVGRSGSKGSKISKGMSSAVLLSIAIHAALFFLAGALVVFTVVKKREVEFEPPRTVERPKMKLKKPKVKIKKTSRPKPTQRIVTKVNRASMPDIQLPEMSGMGEGLDDVMDGFDVMPDLGESTLYGASRSIGNDFVGTFYDTKRDCAGRTLSGVDTSGVSWRALVHKFLVRGWDTSVFSRYFRSPKKLYATSFLVPITRGSLVPQAFGDEKAVGSLWVVHYKGQLVCPVTHTNGITFRFWGAADEFLAVRVNGELAIGVSWDKEDRRSDATYRAPVFGSLWASSSADDWKYWLGNTKAVVGDWITLEPGEPLDMEVLIGDNGALSGFFLLVEEKGVEYKRSRQDAPILPVFRTAELSHDMLDAIYKNLHVGEMVCLTNGPVFSDYDTSVKAMSASLQESAASNLPPSTIHTSKPALRTWILADGGTMAAEFVNIFGEKVVLKDAKGKIRKIPKERLSEEDLEYAELASPPDLDINFLKSFKTVSYSGGWYDVARWSRPSEDQGYYGFQIKQTSPGDYGHDLKAEMFVLGKQWRRGKYVLLDRQATTFNLAEQEQRFYEFRSKRKVVELLDEYYSIVFGEKHYGYLIVITDARGKTVAMKSSHKWLPGILENLRKLSVGNFMDETGVRTYPDRPPKSTKY